MKNTLTSQANGRQPGHGTGEEHILTCGEEMDAEENMDSTRATLLEILEDRTARVLENEKDISAVERVMAILDAKQRTGTKGKEAEATDEVDKAEARAEETDGAEATGEAELTDEAGPKPKDEETQEKPHTGPADSFSDLLTMPIDWLKEIAGDPEAAVEIFVQARGGETLACPGCGSESTPSGPLGRTRGPASSGAPRAKPSSGSRPVP